MPQCSFKNCKNHTSRTLKKDGVSYFRFPRDPVQCAEWITIIARQRSEEFFKPTPGSVICSNHFLESDKYVTNKGIKRLQKTALPRMETSDEEEDDKKSIEPCCLEPEINIITTADEDCERPNSSLSNLSIGSVLDTPKEIVLKKKLRACKNLLKAKNNKIDCLRKQNMRLKKKCENLKNVMNVIMKRYTTDQTIRRKLSKKHIN